ncbi:MAG: glycosyltransferase family 2 protein [Rhizobiaceae bacterium]
MARIELLEAGVSTEFIGVRTDGDDLKALDGDPQLVFKPEHAIEPGWYRIDLGISSEERLRPQVYFDFGGGFSEVFSTRLRPNSRNSGYFAIVRLPFPVLIVRLDPTEAPCDFTISSFRFKLQGPHERALALGRQGLSVMRRHPRAFLRQLPIYLKALRQPVFLQMRETPNIQTGTGTYDDWIARHDFDEKRDARAVRAAVEALAERPKISVIMPVYNTPENLLEEAIASVAGQIYPDWELCIADDCSTAPHVRPILERWSRADPRVKIAFREENGHISHATNSAFALVTGEWVAMFDHDDLLRPHSLAEIALEIARHPDAEVIYSDEDKLGENGRRYEPYFKPDFSRELFRSQNYLNHLTVHRAANIRAVGGWRPGFEGSQDYDLNLRVLERIDMAKIRHIPKVLYHWRAVAGSTAVAGSEKSYAYAAGKRALEEHVDRMRLPARVEEAPDTPFYRLRFDVPDPAPLVSLIIPTRDRVELLRGCIESIRSKTTYGNYEIVVVDNGSTEPETLAYFRELKNEKAARILAYDEPFNYSAINNFAVKKAKGSIVGLVNNDIEVISPDWLTEMVSWAVQPDIGCVGAKLYYADDTIQHAGVILGIGGVAGHSHKLFPRSSPGYFARLKLVQNLSAVTAACLLVRKEVYGEVGGLNEKDLKVAFNDVDFCLKVREAGYQNVWTPFAELYHLESKSRGEEDSLEKKERFNKEVIYMIGRWEKDLRNDPYYSPSLTLDTENFSIGLR